MIRAARRLEVIAQHRQDIRLARLQHLEQGLAHLGQADGAGIVGIVGKGGEQIAPHRLLFGDAGMFLILRHDVERDVQDQAQARHLVEDKFEIQLLLRPGTKADAHRGSPIKSTLTII